MRERRPNLHLLWVVESFGSYLRKVTKGMRDGEKPSMIENGRKKRKKETNGYTNARKWKAKKKNWPGIQED